MNRVFSSRKFLLFLISVIMAVIGWIYALVYKPDQLMTVSTFIVTLLGAYSGANLADTHLVNQLTIATKPPEPDPAAGQTGLQQNG